MSDWNRLYQGNNPNPWDIGRPQPVFVNLVKNGELSPPAIVLDVGCGTGENAILFGQNGFTSYGVDLAEAAIERAIAKAEQRRTRVDFRVGDVLGLEFDDGMFDYVTDCGLFHTFDNTRRRRFVEKIARVLKPRGTYFMLCFSDKEPTDWGGPRRVSKKEIVSSLDPLFVVNYVRDELFATRIDNEGGRAYLASATRKTN